MRMWCECEQRMVDPAMCGGCPEFEQRSKRASISKIMDDLDKEIAAILAADTEGVSK